MLACLEGHIGIDALALDVVREADDSGLGDLGIGDKALSTSAVPMRWPDETLITSSTRPVIQ